MYFVATNKQESFICRKDQPNQIEEAVNTCWAKPYDPIHIDYSIRNQFNLFISKLCFSKPSGTLFPLKKSSIPPSPLNLKVFKYKQNKTGVFQVCSDCNLAPSGNPVSDECLDFSVMEIGHLHTFRNR